MKSARTKILLLLILLSGTIFNFFSQQQPPPKPRDLIIFNIDLMKKDLNLTDDQAKKITEIMNDSYNQIEVKHINLERAMLDIKEQLLKDSPDLTKIKEIIDRKSAIFSDIEFIIIKRDLNIKSILTKEQLLKWREFNKFEPQFNSAPFLLPPYSDFEKQDYYPVRDKKHFTGDKKDNNKKKKP